MTRFTNRTLGYTCALAAAALMIAVPTSSFAKQKEVRASGRALAAEARALGRGDGLKITGLALEGQTESSTLDLVRFDVWRPGATVLVDGQLVTPPDTAYFRGSVEGDAASLAMVSVRESGEVQGLVQKGGRTWLVGKGRSQRSLKSKRADEQELAPFECGVDTHFTKEQRLGLNRPDGSPHGVDDAPAMLAGTTTAENTVLDQPYRANIAIETDYEYFARFGNTQAALDYMADIIGYADLTYSREVNTDMQIGFARLWTTGAANDPWNATSGTDAALTELRSYWNANMSSTNRTVVQMLSGKGLGGGIAWLSVLCDNYGSRGNSYDYGLSASLGTNFSWDGDQSHDPSTVVWDIVVVQHEIGHNFSSPHGHDYCNIGGSSLPIDNCWSGCQAGATVQLPSCSAPTPHFTSGGGSGTIMSYCHQRTGGYGNIAMTFGENHTCGTLPGREATQMTNHVVSRANAYPTCFAGSNCGNGVIDSGEQCDGGNLNGGTCASRGFAGGTLSCSGTCQYNTTQCTMCGNNVINSGEVCDGTALGGQTCTQQGCTGGGTLACNSTCSAYNKTGCVSCPPCNGNGICDNGEDCNGCPSDCIKGTTTGAVCGNGKCEAGNGEDCLSCASDCNGSQGGKPQSRYCCGDGSGSGPIPCTDSRCTASGRQCTTVPSVPVSYCCGTDTCTGPENCSNCATDCTAPSETCGNGVDDNCNAQIDCADGACSTLTSCQCRATNQACTSNSQCCSGTCRTKGKNPNTCS